MFVSPCWRLLFTAVQISSTIPIAAFAVNSLSSHDALLSLPHQMGRRENIWNFKHKNERWPRPPSPRYVCLKSTSSENLAEGFAQKHLENMFSSRFLFSFLCIWKSEATEQHICSSILERSFCHVKHPQARDPLGSWTLFSFSCCLRSSTGENNVEQQLAVKYLANWTISSINYSCMPWLHSQLHL